MVFGLELVYDIFTGLDDCFSAFHRLRGLPAPEHGGGGNTYYPSQADKAGEKVDCFCTLADYFNATASTSSMVLTKVTLIPIFFTI
jgi:hypothetical protein